MVRQAPPSEVVARPEADQRMRHLYEQHARPVYRYLLSLTSGNQQAAEDLLQETLVRAWHSLDALNPRIETLRPWLFTVARRLAIDATRARRVRPVPADDVDVGHVAAPVDSIDQLLTAHTVRQALPRLSQDHRRIVLELYYNGRTTREIAELIGIPEGTVRSRAFYALRVLREAIGPALREAS